MNEETTTTKGKRLKLEVTNMDALKAKYPDAVKKVVTVKEDHGRLYELAQAHMIIGQPIPGVTITHPDGRVLDGSQAEFRPLGEHVEPKYPPNASPELKAAIDADRDTASYNAARNDE